MLKETAIVTVLIYLCFHCCSAQGQIRNDSIQSKEIKDTIPQKDLFDIAESLFHLKTPQGPDSTDKDFNFSVLPLSTDVPGGGHALVTTVSATFFLGNRKTTRQSEAWFVPYIDFEGRYGVPMRSYIWLKDNKWMIRGDVRILKYPEYSWGMGKAHTKDDKILIDKSDFRFYQHLLKQVYPGLFVGLGYNLDIHMGIHDQANKMSLAEFAGYKYGTKNDSKSISSGWNLNVLYDTRGNSINPTKGNYFNFEYKVNPKFMGSDHSWHSLFLDARKYYNLNSAAKGQNVVALWSYYWTTFRSNAPYFDLPAIGWDSFNTSGRGFIQSRFRAKSLFYTEAEYRKDITKNGLFGFVVFTNINTTSGPQSRIFSDWNIGVGAGLRIKVDRISRTNISIDYAISKQYNGIYLTLGEYF